MTAALVSGAEKSAASKAATGGAGVSTARRNSVPVSDAKKRLSGVRRESGVQQARRTVSSGQRVRTTPSTRSTNGSRGMSRAETRRPRSRREASARHIPRRAEASQAKTGVLVAEWLLAVVLIVVTVPLEQTQRGYQSMMTTMMLRLTGLCGIFFALALMGTSPKAARFSVYFGFIIDLGIIYHASTRGSAKTIANIFTGQTILPGGVSGGAVLAADFTSHDEPESTGGLANPQGPSQGGIPA